MVPIMFTSAITGSYSKAHFELAQPNSSLCRYSHVDASNSIETQLPLCPTLASCCRTYVCFSMITECTRDLQRLETVSTISRFFEQTRFLFKTLH